MSPRKTDPARRTHRPAFWLRWGAWLAAAAGGLVFLNTISNGFVYDDLPIVRDNPRIRSLGNLPEIWMSDWWQPQDAEQEVGYRHRDRLYRPLAMFTFALNYAIGGLRPVGYHLVNIGLHAAACWLVWRFAQRLFADTAISSCAALLFAVHPIHCEAVAGVVGRAEVLASLFLLLGLLVLLPAGRAAGLGRAAGAAVLFLAALFSKETAVCYMPVALIVLHAAAEKPARGRVRWWLMHAAVLLVPLVVYLPLRYAALDHHLLRDAAPTVFMNPLVLADLPHRWLHALTILGHYTRLLVVPAQLSANYGLAVIDPDRGPELMTLVGAVTVVVAAVALVGYARPQTTWRRLAVLTALSIASYALISNTVLLIGVSLAERLLYWPSVPMLLAVALAVVQLWRYAASNGKLSAGVLRLLRVCGVLLLVGLGLRSVVRNADWWDNLVLFARDVQTHPRSAELNEAVANEVLWELSARPDPDRIVALLPRAPADELWRAMHGRRGPGRLRPLLEWIDGHLATALEVNPRSVKGMQLRGRVLGMLGDRQRAIAYFESATQFDSLDRVSQQLLAKLRADAEQEAARLAALAEQVSTRPADAVLRLEYGELLRQRGRYPEALAEIEEAARLAPEDGEVLRRLGEACLNMNEDGRALELLQRAVLKSPEDWRIHVNLSALLAGSDPDASLRHAREAHRLHPDAFETNQTLAEALAANEQFDEALEIYRTIYRSLPPDDFLRGAIEGRIRDLRLGRP